MSRKECGIIKKGKLLLGAAVMSVALTVTSLTAFAAGTVSVTPDKSNAAVSEKITVAVQTSEPEDPASPPQISVNYDPAVLQFDSCDVDYGGGEGGLVTITGTGGVLTFTTLAEGTANVSAEAVIDDDGNNPATGSASITVGSGSAAATEQQSVASNATLRALAIDPGVLSPAFSSEVTDYTITVEEGVTDITVSGGVTDSTSQITSANGFKNLEEGENDAQITVTASDGSTLTYHFHIVRGDTAAAAMEAEAVAPAPAAETTAEAENTGTDTEAGGSLVAGAGIGGGISSGNDMTILVGQNSYTIQPVVKDELIPAGGSKTTTTYASQNIEAVSFGGLMLVDARSNVDGTEKLFLYDAASDSFQGFAKLDAQNGSYIIPLALPKDLPKGFIADGAELGGAYVACGKLKDSTVEQRENVCLLYAADQEGAQGYFLYDISGASYVHFLNYAAKSGNGAFGTRGLAVIILLAVLLVICLIIMLVMALKKGEDMYDEELSREAHYRSEKPRKSSAEASATREPVRTVKKPRPKEVYEEEEYAPPKKKRPAEPVREDRENGTGAASMQATVKKVKKKKPVVKAEGSELGDDFDINREIESMKENAAKKTATARMENMEAALKNRSTTRTVMPEKKTVREEMARKPESVKVKKAARPVRSEEITIDKPIRKPAARTAKTVRPEADYAQEGGRPKVTKTVTEKGVTYTTGKIPITVVKSTKSAGENNGSVPIFTLDKEAASLSRESLPQEPDTDFKFDFIDLDKNDE